MPDPSEASANPLLLDDQNGEGIIETYNSVYYFPTVQELQQGSVDLLVKATPITPCSPAVSDVITIQFSNLLL